MTANTGVTNLIFLKTLLDDVNGTLTDLSVYVKDPGAHGLAFAKAVQTGLGERVENITLGNPTASFKIKFRFDTVVVAHLTPLVNRRVPLSIDFRHGISHDWEAGEPTYGMTSSSTSGVVLSDIQFSGEDIDATFDVVGGTAPTFATAAHT